MMNNFKAVRVFMAPKSQVKFILHLNIGSAQLSHTKNQIKHANPRSSCSYYEHVRKLICNNAFLRTYQIIAKKSCIHLLLSPTMNCDVHEIVVCCYYF